MKLSIIVPMYNVEEFLDKCLLSLLDQDVSSDDYEIIAIDDESPDNSFAIASNYANKYGHIRVVCQTNKGLSGARNKGIEEAKGEYLWFIDSDDWIEKNCLKGILGKCFDNNLDVYSLQRYHSKDGVNTVFPYGSMYTGSVVDGKTFMREFSFAANILAQLYIVKRSYLNVHKIRFTEGIIHEDNEYIPRALFFAERLMHDECPFYYHLQRTASISGNANVNRCRHLITVSRMHLEFIEHQNVTDDMKKVFYSLVGVAFNSIFEQLIRLPKEEVGEILDKLKDNKGVFRRMIQCHMKKYQVEGLLFTASPRLFYTLFKSLKRV